MTTKVDIENLSDILEYGHSNYNKLSNLNNITFEMNSDSVFKPVHFSNSDIGFRLAHYLWVMRGSNMLNCLQYYDDHMDEYTDDNFTLRGALGPRLKFWVGADQLQEAININMNIDEEEDYQKPRGVDQFRMCYEDLRDEDINTTVMTFFDPSIDFEATNDIPDLVSACFAKRKEDGAINMTLLYSCFNPTNNAYNEICTMRLIHAHLCSWLKVGMGSFVIHTSLFEYDTESQVVICEEPTQVQEFDSDIDNFWNDIVAVSHFERHLRMMVNEKTVNNPEIAVGGLVENLESNVISKVKGELWVDFAYMLLIWSLKTYAPQQAIYEDFVKSAYEKMSGALKQECSFWLQIKEKQVS